MLALVREPPDTSLAARFDGEPMVQSFLVPGGGRAWITTAEALTIPAFGREWVAARLAELAAELGPERFAAALAGGVRLSAEALALAA